MYQSAIQDRIFINPTIFSYYGQSISIEYEMPCRYLNLQFEFAVHHYVTL